MFKFITVDMNESTMSTEETPKVAEINVPFV